MTWFYQHISPFSFQFHQFCSSNFSSHSCQFSFIERAISTDFAIYIAPFLNYFLKSQYIYIRINSCDVLSATGEGEDAKRRRRHDTEDSSDKNSEAAKYVLHKYFVVYQALQLISFGKVFFDFIFRGILLDFKRFFRQCHMMTFVYG
jgi:hypothetical protein